MRRIIIIGAALAVLVGAAAAYATTYYNSYTAKLSFSPSKAGSAKAPSPFKMEQILTAAGQGGNRAAPLTDIKTTIYGVVANGGAFPTCSDAQIEADKTKYDAACPKGSMVASGPVNSLLGPQKDNSQAAGTPCNPFLHVYNGGKGKLVFFFTTDLQHTCAGLRTGATAPYDATSKQQGKNLVVDVPLPPDVSNKVAGIPNYYGSLIKEDLTWLKLTKKVGGKTVAYQQSVACQNGKRPWKTQFTAQDYNGSSETQTVSGSAKC